MKKLLLISNFVCLFFFFSNSNVQACSDRAAFHLNDVVNLGNNLYQLDMTFCVGGGQSNGQVGAYGDTGSFGFILGGGATLSNFPATLTSPLNGEVYTGITWFNGTALSYESQTWWWACSNGSYWGYDCGPVQTVCKDITLVTNGLPSTIEILGLEGSGSPQLGCMGQDFTVHPPNFSGPGPCVTNDLSASASTDRNKIYLGYDSNPCVTLTVNAQGGTGTYDYLWDNNNPNASVTVCPQQTTTYEVTVRDYSCGFVTTASVTVEVEDVRCGSNNDRVMVCHRGRNKCVSKGRANKLLNKGATLGTCGTSNRQIIEPETDTNVRSLEISGSGLEVAPNPILHEATISFVMPSASQVNIQLFDLNGRLVRQVYNGPAEAQLSYQINFQRENLNKGLYILSLYSDEGERITRKIVIQ